jgi:hypothetical protein
MFFFFESMEFIKLEPGTKIYILPSVADFTGYYRQLGKIMPFKLFDYQVRLIGKTSSKKRR